MTDNDQTSATPDRNAIQSGRAGWIHRLRAALRRQSRTFYRKIRHPRHRGKGRIRQWFADRIHDRNLWRFRRGPVARGLAGGLFFSMLPLPLQGAFAAGVGITRGWNLPAAIAATWLSNPLTYAPMFLGARACVIGVYRIFGASPAIQNLTPDAVKDLDWNGFVSLVGRMGPELLLGYGLLGAVCALIGYVFVHSIWPLFPRHELSAAAELRDLRRQERERKRQKHRNVTGRTDAA